MDAPIVGKYQLERSENFDNFLRVLGFGFIKRKLANLATPVVTIERDKDTWRVKSVSSFTSSEFQFKPGEEFDQIREDGIKVKTKITLDGNKVIQVQKGGNVDTVYVRVFTKEGMTTECKAKDVTCTRVYKRIE